MAALRAPLHPLLLLVHSLGLASSVFMLAWTTQFRGGLSLIADNKDLIFNVHPVLMFIGYIFLSSEAILVYKTIPGTKSYQKGVHLALQALAFVFAIVGIWAAFKYHNEKGIANLYSLHSWLGLATVIMFGLQWVLGYYTFWYPGAAARNRTILLPWHIFLGLFIHGLALVTAETGLLEKLTFLQVSNTIERYSWEAMFVNCLGLLMAMYGGLVILATIVPNTRKEENLRALD